MVTIATGTQPLKMLLNESRLLGIEFDQWGLEDGEALSGPVELVVTLKGQVVDTSTGPLVVGSPVINGTLIQFQVTTTDAIVGSFYRFDCRCPTSLVPNVAQSIRELEIIGRG